ncbi:MAG: hypothetical protein A3H57_03865 [Candidatus Taylorbacteria bacterium RIFCSPLOWO2_02_FULL_43_11]|uniref:Uncharacterized protein n=1 Tax=Candidatus Taylorbacteria bacterium RIFCSPHIGHO2_02_FULL_43_32b TaxID=1802306 RepID=A0A1G2MJL1_9BACT|nr:MAG: hypothetical protein A2743_01340 [Candidatus Taylorbacteria bacterium RIFCSPHIGHO2_01_FULL_43_47]OHA24063.1 MAG: hypothetical protein A3C72_02925 [Candidatus Taylorbacteria bacterium RIFCSPHIGHO2_02_FULL_43_32b]OHA31473.1 MAG: hypothetical protein A3B08_00820 [Candidatus Taylorbacteria bacterium RIFCSPLOWO2_01_FULL_43_44]OHA37524.1 MAG: hypothetical protein A3H57_03865 [Candidatus Taylorbacteria bacterium RIFCSPLOWO2_02_FULL_43_11]
MAIIKKISVGLAILIFFGLNFSLSMAQTTPRIDVYPTLAPLPNSNGVLVTEVVVGGNQGIGTYLNNLYKMAVAGASVLAVLMIVIGGFTYLSTDAIGNKEEGKSYIKNALGGMLLILASWIILNTINPQLVQLNIISKKLESVRMESLFLFSENGQKQFDAMYEELRKSVLNRKEKLQNMKDQLSEMQSQLDTYKYLQHMDSLGALSPIETIALQQLEPKIQALGGASAIEAKITDLTKNVNQISLIDGTYERIENIRVQSLTLTTPTTILSASETLRNIYTSTVAKIDALDTHIYTADAKTDYKTQFAQKIDQTIEEICKNGVIPEKIVDLGEFTGGATSNDDYSKCLSFRILPSGGAGGNW